MSSQTDQLASPKPEYTLEQWIQSDKFKRNLEALLRTPENVERFIQIAIGALKRQPKLKECWQPSIFDCLLKLNQIGLEPDGYHAHLVPFRNNKTERMEAQLIIDYKGLVTVIRRNPEITVVKGAVVYSLDGFRYSEGSNRVFEHQPTWKEPSKDNVILGAYSFVKYKDGDWEVDFLPTWKIERAREASRAKDTGPWVTHYDEQCIKTAHRHHSKTLPLKPEQRLAIAADDDQFEYEPFDNRPSRLPMRPPEFLTNESSVPPTDQRGSAEPASAVQGRPTDTNEGTPGTRRRGRPPREESVKPDDSQPAAATATEPAKPAEGAAQEPDKEEKAYQFGPGDDGGAQDNRTSEHQRDASREQESSQATPKVSAKAQELLALMTKHQIGLAEVVGVLKDHDIDVGAGNAITDLPESTVSTCVKQWATIMFNVKQRRANQPTAP